MPLKARGRLPGIAELNEHLMYPISLAWRSEGGKQVLPQVFLHNICDL